MSREAAKGLGGALLALTGQTGNLLLLAATAIVLPRLLGPTDYGRLSATLAVVAVAFVVSTLGLPFGESRYLSPLRGAGETRALSELASSFWVVRLAASSVAALACALVVRLSGTEPAWQTAGFVGLFALARFSFQATRSLLLPLDRLRGYVTLELLQTAAFLAAFLGGYLAAGLAGGFLSAAAAQFVLLALAFSLARGRTPLSVRRFRPARLRPLLGFNSWAFVGAIANSVRTFLPVWAVATWAGAQPAAFFGLAVQALVWTTLFTAMLQAMLPILSELEAGGESDRVRAWIDWPMRAGVAVLCVAAVTWSLLGREVIELLLGGRYLPAFRPVALLLAAAMATVGGTAVNTLNFLRERARSGALNLALLATVTLAGMAWALAGEPKGAAERSAWVYLGASFLFLASSAWSIRRHEHRWLSPIRLLVLMAPAALAAWGVGWTAEWPIRFAVAVAFAIAYAGLVLGAGLVRRSELRYLAGVLLRGPSEPSP